MECKRKGDRKMKFSELSTDRAMIVICELIPHINAIAIDEELINKLKEKINPTGEPVNTATMITLGAQRINEIAPILLRKHKREVYGILAALSGSSIEEIGKQNIIKTMLMIRETCRDPGLNELLRSF